MPRRRLLQFVTPILYLAVGQGPQAGVPVGTYEQVFDELRRIAPRANLVAPVKDLVLRRDAMEFRLASGTMYLLTPVAGQTVGAVFLGAGSVTFTVPLEVERRSMRHLLRDSLLNTPITAAVFVFTDSTLTELERQVTFAPSRGEGLDQVAGPVGDALGYLTDRGERWVDPTLMSALLNRDLNGLFYGFIKRQRGEHLMFQVDPHQLEEITLLRRGRQQGQRVQTVCQFQQAEDLRAGVAPRDEQPQPLKLQAYHIEARIDGGLDFSAVATVRFTALRDSVRWVLFLLYDELDVDSVLTGTGDKAMFFRERRSPGLWIRLDSSVLSGQSRTVRIAYHGDLIDRASLVQRLVGRASTGAPQPAATDRWAFIKSTWTWFPRYSEWQAADMELTFHTPTSYRFSSIGKLVESRVAGDVRTTRWITEVPTEHAGFNIGEFSEFAITDPRIPPVTVHLNSGARTALVQLVPGQLRPDRDVGTDIANSLAFFTRVFGTPLFEHYYATEIPWSHGQAFPGLIHLSWWTFQDNRGTGWEEIFRAHEMAHQWWGIGVEPAVGRDAWLSEGFAMFAGLWYMQAVLEDNEKYFRQLRDWRRLIRGVRHGAPPVGLGYRVAQTDPEDYDIIVYRKGAWVLHMLRNMMLDYQGMKEGAFTAMMRDFYEQHRGRRATTADFQSVVERHLNRPMGWYFDQWVYGTDIPTYTLSWRSERAPEGQYVLKLKVRQEDVPEDFAMPVPVSVESAGGDRTIVRIVVRGPVTEVSLPFAAEPRFVELNPFESVLAEVKQAPWR